MRKNKSKLNLLKKIFPYGLGLLLAIIFFGAGVHYCFNAPNMAYEIEKYNESKHGLHYQDVSSSICTENDFECEKTDTSSWGKYQNKDFGFEMKLPGNIKHYSFEIDQTQSRVGLDQQISITRVGVNYQLDNKVLRSFNQPELGYIEKMKVWNIIVIPAKEYSESACNDNIECKQAEILAKNDKFVFLSGRPNIEGAGYLCLEERERQVNFCKVDEIFGREDLVELIDFNSVD